MMMDFSLVPLLPEIFLAIIAMGLLLVGAMRGNESAAVISWSCASACLVAFLLLLGLRWDEQIILNGLFQFDAYTGFMKGLVLLGMMGTLAVSVQYIHQENMARFEYPVMMLFAAIGMMVMISAHNMLSLYIGLELQSLALYVLAAFQRNSSRSAEAGIKYFVLGAISSGMLLFGISLVYGYTGSLDFSVIAATLQSAGGMPIGAVFGLVFVLVAMAFKLSAVPFHMWSPDVYQGAPTSVTAFFSIVPKLAAAAVLLRLLFGPFAIAYEQWMQIIYALSILSMTLGAFAAIGQENIKRLLAYSSIGHVGYALVGLVPGLPGGIGASIFYLVIYMIMSLGVFGIVLCLRRGNVELTRISDMAGLSKNHPLLAYGMAILMFSMAGLPPVGGFFAKLMVFEAAVAGGYYVLAVAGVLTSVVAAYYYLRIVKVMFFDDAKDPLDKDIGFAKPAIISVCVFLILGFAFNPNVLVYNIMIAVTALMGG